MRCYLKNKLSAASSSKQFGAVRSLMALRWRLPKGSQLGSHLFLLPRPHTRTGQGIVIVPVVFACIYLCAARANELHTSTAAAQFARGLPTVGPPCQGVGGSPRGSQLGSPFLLPRPHTRAGQDDNLHHNTDSVSWCSAVPGSSTAARRSLRLSPRRPRWPPVQATG